MRHRHADTALAVMLFATALISGVAGCDNRSSAIAIVGPTTLISITTTSGGVICTAGGPMTTRLLLSGNGVQPYTFSTSKADSSKVALNHDGLVTAVAAGLSGYVTVTVTDSKGARGSIQILLDPTCGGTGNPPPPPDSTAKVTNLLFWPDAVCYSALVGGPLPQAALQITGEAGAVIKIASASRVIVVSPTTVTLSGPVESVTLTFTIGDTPTDSVTNATVSAEGKGASSAMNVAIRTKTGCSGSSISYSPYPPLAQLPAVGDSTVLTATAIPGLYETETAKPFWTTNHPELVYVAPINPTAEPLGGINFFWGFKAVLKRTGQAIPSGVVITIAVHWSPSNNTVTPFSKNWTP